MTKLVAKFVSNPFPVWDEIKTYLSDDTGEIERYGKFIGVFDNHEMVGAFLVKPWNISCYEIHGGVTKDYWGRGKEICNLAGASVFHSTTCLKLVAIIPEFNRLMIKCVESIGMVKEGKITKSYLKWSKLHDQIVYGMTKTEFRKRGDLCLRQR